jgi:trypsin
MLLSLLVSFALSAAVPDVQASHIVGGTPVSPQFKYPWLVSLNKGYHFCGGNLLDATTIVTAAHCSVRQNPSSIKVFAHRHDLGQSAAAEKGLVFQVKKITVHPNYTSSSQAYDVAVWKISLISGNAADIPSGVVTLDDGSNSLVGEHLKIAGWGTTSAGGSSSLILLETSVNVISQDTCKRQYKTLHPTSICAASPGKDTCQG